MKRLILLMILIIATSLVRTHKIAGDWQGTFNTGMGELRLVLRFAFRRTRAEQAIPTSGQGGQKRGTLQQSFL